MQNTELQTKKILGLDVGTNSIGAALIEIPKDIQDFGSYGKIIWMGTRILPDSEYKKAFEIGQTKNANVATPAATRRQKRGSRRLKHRYKLRRSRLISVFKELGWVNVDFPTDFKKSKHNLVDFKFQISNYLEFSNITIKEFYKDFGYEENDIDNILKEISFRKKHQKKLNDEIKLLPEDWIIYYLRKKALTEKIEISELARIIYMLNQRRGFKSSRKDLKDSNVLPYEDFIKRIESKDFGENGIETKFVSITKVLKVEEVKEDETKKKKNNKKIYKIFVEDERIRSNENERGTFEIEYKKKPDWEGKQFTYIVTQKISNKGKFTQNKPDIAKDGDWELCTNALDEKIDFEKYPGKYFYNELLKAYKENRTYKIRQFPVYRWRYKEELKAIWEKQLELNPELKKLNKDKNILKRLAEILYPTQAKNGLSKLQEFLNNDLHHIISNDIIYYQRELKSQKNLIKECRYEKRIGKEKDENGNWIETGKYGLKCIPKSSPLFQEFRIWQDIHNIKIFKREEKVDEKVKLNIDYTNQYITDKVKEELFEKFNQKTSINEKDILEIIIKNNEGCDIVINKKGEEHSHRINLFTKRESLKGNETKIRYKNIFNQADYDGEEILNDVEKLQKLWHIDYSITSSDQEKSEKGIKTALNKLLPEKENKQKVIELFLKLSELPREYGSYSAMAIKKLLPLMRVGKYWSENAIQEQTKNRIQKILDDEFDELLNINIKDKIKKWEKENRTFTSLKDFNGLPTWLAGYVVYGIHSENEIENCKTSDEFNDKVILKLKNNSLRNPVVEQVVRETLLLVRDLWKQLERKNEKIDEIHIELGRELKNNTEEKQKIADSQKKNFEEKQRIKALLKELLNDGFKQTEDEDEPKFIDGKFEFRTKEVEANFEVKPNPENPTDIEKFKIWKSLSKRSDLEWEKKVKDEKIPKEQEIKRYILWLSQECRSPYTGKLIPLSKLFNPNQYEIEHIIPRAKMKNDSMSNLVISEWGVNKAKGNQLAANFIYDSKGKCKYGDIEYKLFTYKEYVAYCNDVFKFNKVKRNNLLATDVPEDFIERQLNDTRFITKKVAQLLKPVVGSDTKIIFTGGSITSELKKNWGLTKEWKKMMLPRFKRLEAITGKTYIKQNEHDRNDIDINVPENDKLDIKRIDHRHHALDALIVAATTREHIRYLNSLNAVDSNEELIKIKQSLVKGKIRDFNLPWETFTKEACQKLEETIVSFKVNNKIISQPTNQYSIWSKDLKKIKIQQKPNKRWMSVRKSMFKEPLGVKWIKQIKSVKVKDAFKIEIDRQINEHDKELRKTASYIYDKQARQIIKQIIHQCNTPIDEKEALLKEIDAYLNKNKNKTGYLLNGIYYEKIDIAELVSYKTKRMALTKKEYVEGLTIDKMKKDFPYFDTISKQQFELFDADKQKLITQNGIKVSDTKAMNDFNFLFLTHILEFNDNPKEAFSQEGIDYLNKKAKENPKIGKEIKSVTRLDGKVDREDMFNGGFYETDKGAMAYFVIYENEETKKRSDFESIPVHKAIEKIINNKPIAEDKHGYKKIILQPGDLVYVPTKEEIVKIQNNDFNLNLNNLSKICNQLYQVRKFTGKEIYFLKATISDLILPYDEYDKQNKRKYGEFGSQNYLVFNDDGLKIVDYCIKIELDRLGNVII